MHLLVAALLGAACLLGPLPYGSVRPGAQLALRLVAFAALLVALRIRGLGAVRERIGGPLAAIGGLALLGLLQSLPLPAFLVRWIAPGHHELASAAALAAIGGAEPRFVSLSLAPEVSRSAGLAWAAAGAALLAAALAGGSRRARRTVAVAVLGGGALQAGYGLREVAARAVPRLNGTLVNPNHVALYLAFALLVGVGISWLLAIRVLRRQRLERWLPALVAAAALTLLIAVALFHTGSRSGMLAAAAGLAALGAAALAGRRRRRWAWVALVPIALVVFIALDTARFNRLLSGVRPSFDVESIENRVRVGTQSLGLLARFPVTGTGLGTFLEAFPLVQERRLADARWVRAHSEPVELLVTGGLVGGALALWGLATVGLALWRRSRRATRTESRMAAAVGLAILTTAIAQGLFDFGLSVPANGLTAATLIGAAMGSSPRRSGESRSPGPAARARAAAR